jgi:protein N-terminal methyltransferase
VIWCQWCLGHLNDDDFVAFLRRCKGSLRPPPDVGHGESVIVVKENVCANHVDGRPRTVFDDEDSSLTRFRFFILVLCNPSHYLVKSRSDLAWKKLFANAGLKLVSERVQLGLPSFLYDVKM